MGLTVNTPAAIVKWGRGDTTKSVVVKHGGEYAISVFLNDGCTTEKKILLPEVDSPKIDLGNDTIFCEGELIPILLEVLDLYQKYEESIP